MGKKTIKMVRRTRYIKRLLALIIMSCLALHVIVLLFGDLRTPTIMKLTDLNQCPACYGISICPELYSNQISIEAKYHLSLFNTKNIYHGYTKSNRKVVLKKLAHNWEFKEFDTNMCKKHKLKDCKPINLLNVSNLDEEIIKLVQYNVSAPDMEVRKGLVMCPYASSIYDFLQPVLNKKVNYKSDLINVWTMLSINPEPIVIQAIPRSNGWRVPAYGGVCGRLEMLGYEGEPLSSKMHVPWHTRLKYAKQIIDAALDFTFKHDRFRFYLMDWSLDNMVANDKDEVAIVDLEDIVVIDKHISPTNELPNWYKRYLRTTSSPGFTFSIENLCKHHLSDHNIWAACYIILEQSHFIMPVPSKVDLAYPSFKVLFNDCLKGGDRFQIATKLQALIKDMLMDEGVVW